MHCFSAQLIIFWVAWCCICYWVVWRLFGLLSSNN